MTRARFGLLAALALAGSTLAQELQLEPVPNGFRDLRRSEPAFALPLSQDEEGVLIELGFPFQLYGQTFTQVAVTTNGYLTFGSAVNPLEEEIPSTFPPDAVLAPFWDDLDPRSNPNAQVLVERQGVAGQKILTVQWSDYPLKADPAARLTFQVVLFEGTNQVLFHYGDLVNGDGTRGTGRASGSSASIGVEAGDGQRGIQVAFRREGALRPFAAFAFSSVPALPEGRRLGDLDGDGQVTVLDQSRQVELRSARYRAGSLLELVAADVAPLDSHGALWGDGQLDRFDRDLVSRVIVGRDALPPYLSAFLPGSVAPATTLVLTGSGFDPSDPGRNAVVFTQSGGGTISAPALVATPSRVTVLAPGSARRGLVHVLVNGRSTNARVLGISGIPALLAISPAPGVIGETVELVGLELPATVTDTQVAIGGLPATVLSNGPRPDGTRAITVTVPAALAPGTHPVVVTNLATGAVGEPFPHPFGDLPVVAITVPLAEAVITDRTMVQGTVQDQDLARWELAWAPLERAADPEAFTPFAEGTAQVTSADLGRFDPTLLLNGYYALRLTAIDAQGLTAQDTVGVSVQGNLKIGHFTLRFVDLELPASGVAIQVVREYDSRDKERRDFGVGWAQSFVTLDLEEGPDHSVIVNNPSSSRVEYRIHLEGDNPLVPRFFTVSFRPRDASERSSLDFETPEGVDEGNHILVKDGVGNLFWFPEGIPFDPQVYRLTQLDGTVLRVDDRAGLLQLIKPTGVSLTITRDGILHSLGRSVLFTRDSLDRITAISDAEGNRQTYEYDARGDLVSQTEALGFRSTFTYASNHYLHEWFDPRGIRATKNEYDAAGRLVATVDPFGNRLEFEHDLDGRREVTRDKLGRPTITEYDARGRAIKITGADGAYQAFTHNERDQVVSHRDLNGEVWQFEYDPAGNESATVDPEGRRIEYTYDLNGRILTIKDADQGLWQFAYDPQGNGVREEDPSGGVSTRTYDANGNVTSVTDEANQTTRFDYAPNGDPLRKVDPSGQVTLFTHDANGNLLTETQVVAVPGQPAARATTSWEYDSATNRAKVTRPDGTFVSFRHGEGGRLAERVDSDGRRELYDHDELGRLRQRIGGDGQVERSEYDAVGNQVRVVDREGERTGEYDLRGRLTLITYADGSSVANEWDPMGRRLAKVDGKGQRWTYEYDGAGRLLIERDPSGGETTYTYNGKGQVTSRRDPDLHLTTYEHDAVGRLLRVHFPDGRTVEALELDEAGRVSARQDVFSRRTEFAYGVKDDQTSVSLGSRVWTFGHDSLGRVTSTTDPAGRTTSRQYDPLTGKRVRVVLPLGQQSLATWRDDRPATLTDFDGRVTRLEHDGRGNLTFRLHPDGRGERLTYDPQGRLRALADGRGQTLLVRDPAGRLTARIEPDGRRLDLSYDGNGNLSSLVAPVGTTTYAYDARDRLASVSDATSATTAFLRTRGGVLRSIVRPNGVRTDVETDGTGRVLTVAHVGSSGLLASFTYEHDERGRRARMTEAPSGKVVEWRYDESAQLVSETITDVAGVTTVAYTYDLAGNRAGKVTTRADGTTETRAYVVDANDRLLREDVADTRSGSTAFSIQYRWDESGRLLEREDPGSLARFGYDGIGRLTSAIVVRGTAQDELRFRYDPLGNLVESERNGVVSRHLVEHVSGLSRILADSDAAGQSLVTYTQAEWPVSERDERTGRTLYYLSDAQLSTRLVVDETSAIVGRYEYDAFGVLVGQEGGVLPRFLFGGEPFEPTTGLYHLRSRWLDPRTGRFTTRDGFEGFPGDPPTTHPYLYGLNDPVNRFDPPGTYSTNTQCIFALDLPAALAALDVSGLDDKLRTYQRARLTSLIGSLNVSLPRSFDLIWSDRDFMLAFALVEAALTGTRDYERGLYDARTVPARAARSYLFGSKIYGRIGPDAALALARRPVGELKADRQLREDRARQLAAQEGRWTPPEPIRVSSRVTDMPLFKEVQSWVMELQGSGEVHDVRQFEFQRNAEQQQVGYNHPHLAFTVGSSGVRWNLFFQSSSVPTVSEVERAATNDPRAITIELRDDATLADFLQTLRGGLGPPARFVLSGQVSDSSAGGLPVLLKEAIPERNKAASLLTTGVSVGVGVQAHSGEFVLARTDMRVGGVGIDWELSRVYRSGSVFQDEAGGLRARMPLGHNWTLNYDMRIGELGTGQLLELDPAGRLLDGHLIPLERAGGDGPYERPRGVFAELVRTPRSFRWQPTWSGTPFTRSERCTLRRSADGLVLLFNAAGWLVALRDRHGNQLELLRDENHVLRAAIDTVGRRYRYEYTRHGERELLSKVVDETAQREVTYAYDPETLDLLAATSPAGRTERYEYSSGEPNPVLNHNLLRVFLPAQTADARNAGVAAIENRYGGSREAGGPGVIPPESFSFDSVIEQRVGGSIEVSRLDGTSAIVSAGGVYRFAYEDLNSLGLLLDTDSRVVRTVVTDRRGKRLTLELNGDGAPLLVEDAEQNATVHRHNADGLRNKTTLPDRQTEHLLYDETNPVPSQRGNLLVRAQFPSDGSSRAIVTEYDYDPVFNQPIRVSETEAFEPVSTPPPAGLDPRRWLTPSDRFADFTSTVVMDYQEGPQPDTPAALRFLFRYDLPRLFAERVATGERWALTFGLGDVNGDGEVGAPSLGNELSAPGFRGVAVKMLTKAGETPAGLERASSLSRYNREGQLVFSVDPHGNTTTLTYAPRTSPPFDPSTGTHACRLVEVVADDEAAPFVTRTTTAPPVRARSAFRYDALGEVAGQENPLGTVTETVRDRDGLVVAMVRGANDLTNLGYRTRYQHDGGGRVTRVRTEAKAEGRSEGDFVLGFTYDLLGNVLEEGEGTVVQPEGQTLGGDQWAITHHDYDPEQLRVRTAFPEGNALAWEYDDRALLSAERRGAGTPLESVQRVSYTPTGNPLLVRLPDGNAISNTYDGFDRLRRTTLPTGAFELRHYDAAGQLEVLERFGRPQDDTSELGTGDTSSSVLLSRVRYERDPRRRVVREHHDLLDGVAAVSTTLTWRREFDLLDRLVKATDPIGQATSQAYDGLGRVVTRIDPIGNRVDTSYFPDGSVREQRETDVCTLPSVAPQVFRTSFEVDGLGRATRIVDNASRTFHLAHDSRDNVVASWDAVAPVASDGTNGHGNKTSFVFDARNRLVQTVVEPREGAVEPIDIPILSNTSNPDGKITVTYTHDRNSRLTSVLDDRGNATVTSYDVLDRPVAVQDAAGRISQFVYNTDGTLRTSRDANGSEAQYSYDASNRVVEVVVARGPGVVGTTRQTYRWDGLGRLVSCTDNNGATSPAEWAVVERQYDSLSRQLAEQQNGHSFRWEWGPNGRLLSTEYPGGRKLIYGHDALDRVTSIGGVLTQEYLGDGPRVLRRTLENGTTLSLGDDPEAPNLPAGYDLVGRPVSLKHHSPAPLRPAFVDRSYEYTRNDLRTSERRNDDAGLADRWHHDAARRLVRSIHDEDGGATPRQITSRRYFLDGVGNRRRVDEEIDRGAERTVDYSVNALNQYTSVGETPRQYDQNGNLTDDGQFRYKYDYRNRLVEVVRVADDSLLARYRYDCEGRRVAKRVMAPDSSLLEDTRYLYDGWQEVEERNASGQVTGTYVYGFLHPDDVVQFERTGGGVYYLHQDARANVVAITDGAGNPTPGQRRTYDDFGAMYDESKQPVRGFPDIKLSCGFQGRRLDSETGLYYFRARYYDPATGRFISRDPVWDPMNMGNPYTGFANNPVTFTDPSGKFIPALIAWAGMEIGAAYFFGGAAIAGAGIYAGREAYVQSQTSTSYDYGAIGRAGAGGSIIGLATAVPGGSYLGVAASGVVSQAGDDLARGQMSSLGQYAFAAALGPALKGGFAALGRLRGARAPFDPIPDTDLLSRAHNAWRGGAGAAADDYMALALLQDTRLAWTMTSHGVQEFLAGNQGAMRAGFLDFLQHEAGTLRILTGAETAALEQAAAFSATRTALQQAVRRADPTDALHAGDIRHLGHSQALGIPLVSFDQTFKNFVTETARNHQLGAGMIAGRDEIMELLMRLGPRPR